MEIGELKAFVEVAHRTSFRQAAEALFVTQPTVTARIQALERELGERLFDRSTRVVHLTEPGKLFLTHVERGMRALEDARTSVTDFRNSKTGVLRIAAARVIGTYVLPGILHAFRVKRPGVEIVIRTGRSAEVVEMVLNDEVQLGLTRFIQHPKLNAIHLYDEEIVLVTHPSHHFASQASVTLADVGREPLILYDPGSFYYDEIGSACQRAGIVPNVVMQLDSIEATKKMVELGLGISLLPHSSFVQEQEIGTLTSVDIQGDYDVRLATTILHRKIAALAGPSRAFIDVVQELPLNRNSTHATAGEA
ncbi:MAG: LysR family transcriptional regulator [SAR202 cluster bacterium]|jgi:DNA-binding transcriptional LysR family regulator|nr:LysR family transcriptional regulator [SAR202 cluster bacterium]MDP6800996.1 LysR family transcriptional regulator [SAR202 cluster bacterium]